MIENQPLHLFVIDDSSNDTETISNTLRNAGHPVHASRIEDDEDLRKALATQECDLILTKPQMPNFTAEQALEVVKATGRDAPLLVIGENIDETRIAQLLDAGARDVVSLTPSTRLRHAILREVDVSRDRRRLREFERMLEETSRRAQNLADSSHDAITYIHEGMYIYANEPYLEMFGYAKLEDIEGMPILDMIKGDDHARFKAFLREFMRGKTQDNTFDLTGVRADGSDFEITMELSNASYEGEPCTQIIIRAQAGNEELEKRLQDISKLDLLTGVYNRQFFLDALGKLLGKPDTQGAILYLAPDHFNALRDEMGLALSDQILAKVAKVLKKTLGEGRHFIARFEGQFFCALLYDVNQQQAEALAGNLCKAVDASTYHINGKVSAVTCSIGIALYNEGTRDSQELLQRAEKAMEQAGRQGGNQCQTYIPDEGEMAEQERTAQLSRQIKTALKTHRFQLLFQPIVSIKGASGQHYEVSVTMQDEKDQTIPASEFLPAAEKANLITALDRWVLAHAIKAASQQRRSGQPVVLFVKISPASLRDVKLLPWLRDILKAAHAEPGSLVLQINEEIALTNPKAIKQFAITLQKLHVSLTIDHFGQAENFAGLLDQCEARYLKLHTALIANLGSNAEAMNRVNEITTLANNAGKQVIANAVEDPQTLASVYSTGIDFIQGHFLQGPATAMDYDFDSMG